MTRTIPLFLSSAPVLALAGLLAGGCVIDLGGLGGSASDTGTAGPASTGEAQSTGDAPTTGDASTTGEPGDVPPEQPPAPAMPAGEGIHVAPTGDDASGDGSPGAPYRTIQHVLDDVAGAGAVVLLHAGTYEEAIRIRHSGLTLQSAPGEHAHIACPVSIDEDAPILCVEIDAETAGVTLRGLEVSGGFYSVYLGSQWDYDDSPLDNLAAHDVLIEDCVLHDSGRDVVKVPAGCDDVTIRRCEIYNSGKGYPPETPQEEKNAEGVDAVNADRMHVVDTYVHDTATSCLYVKGGSIGTIVERTRAERCGDLGIVLGFDTSPEFFDLQANPDYYESIGGVVRNCVVADTGLAGIGLYAARDAHVLHNTVIRGGTAGQAGIYLGVATQDYAPEAGRPANTNPTIVGNIVDQSGLAAPVCFGIRHSVEDELGALSGLSGPATIADNLYFAGDAPCLFDDRRPDSLYEGTDLAAWQAHAAGFDAGSQLADPQLTADGHLAATSPAVDARAATPGVAYDIDGAARSGSYDLGADEL
ncbi:right-handed parallel beta-helix repeat-containing protein [Nannocystis pusilla]|uniref:right-handed parallel beta-helix repeat-containing protein n=1 Tax=Nannocystis pusilla TaxID=889268 RepID=UPI003DA2DF5F